MTLSVFTENIDMVGAGDGTWSEKVKISSPNFPYCKFRFFFQIFLLIEILFLKQKLQNGLCSWASRAKMWNHNKKYYTYPETSCYALFKTAKKFEKFSHLSFRTYWRKITQISQSELYHYFNLTDFYIVKNV